MKKEKKEGEEGCELAGKGGGGGGGGGKKRVHGRFKPTALLQKIHRTERLCARPGTVMLTCPPQISGDQVEVGQTAELDDLLVSVIYLVEVVHAGEVQA